MDFFLASNRSNFRRARKSEHKKKVKTNLADDDERCEMGNVNKFRSREFVALRVIHASKLDFSRYTFESFINLPSPPRDMWSWKSLNFECLWRNKVVAHYINKSASKMRAHIAPKIINDEPHFNQWILFEFERNLCALIHNLPQQTHIDVSSVHAKSFISGRTVFFI